MKVVRLLVSETKNWLRKIPRYLTGESVLKTPNMNEREPENMDKDFPNKKLCVETEKEETEESKIEPRMKKVNVALLLGYCGTDYYGMQKNGNFDTIELELLTALLKAKFIPNQAFEDLHQIHFQRAARTDKGVSAAKQVVSLKIAVNYDVNTINSFLPEKVRVFSIKRVTKKFNCKNDCFGRTYSYTLPTYALSPELHKEYPTNFRITDDMILKANKILAEFLGTKNFHNFTSKKAWKDPSAHRYIMSCTAGTPFLKGEEFITLTIKGQSFMLHQIRKMVGYTIATIKGLVPPDFDKNVWKPLKLSVPMAPGLGLVLENLHYDVYNRKYGNDGIHESLTWEELSDDIKKFKETHILPCIIEKEMKEKRFFSLFCWIENLPLHRYDFSREKIVSEANSKEKLVDDLEKLSQNCN